MAGTDRTRPSVRGGPAIVLVRPQLGENIGAAARAMLNFGLTDLRLVRPRDGWPSPKAVAAASGADEVLEDACLYASTEAAVADLRHVYAATARQRDMAKRLAAPAQVAAELRRFLEAGEGAGILFGPERAGLHNDDLALADCVLSIPTNPAYASLNLAQAVLLVGYEWFQAGAEAFAGGVGMRRSRPATKEELLGYFGHLERELDAHGFLQPVEKRPSMVRNIRNMFQRAGLTEQEVRSLHGIVAALVRRCEPAEPPEGI
jgi:tRNA/rRNA methyltransferase